MSEEPVSFKRLMKFDADANNNKYWEAKRFADGRVEIRWGRVGTAGQSQIKQNVSTGWIASKIAEKIQKGYQEVDLHRPTVSSLPVANASPEVEELVQWIYSEAGEQIETYLAGTVDALSAKQINEGRRILGNIALNWIHLEGRKYQVSEYYKTIPTKMPRKIDLDDLAEHFDLAEQENRLDQLQAALSTFTGTAGGNSQYNALGAEIDTLPTSSPEYEAIMMEIKRTNKGRLRHVHGIFKIKIPGEREAYKQCQRGNSRILALWHGTHNPNVRHILKNGLIIPKYPTNKTSSGGSRFGRGIYMADWFSRSMNYCRNQNRGVPKMLFMVNAKVGKEKHLPDDDEKLRQAPPGYDSVRGIKSYGGVDEIIVYNPAQVTIRWLVTFEGATR